MRVSNRDTKDLYPFNRVLPNWLLTRLRLPLFDDELVPLLFLCIEVLLSLLFAIFTIFLFIDQINAIRYDMTYVEYLKEYNVKTLEVWDGWAVKTRTISMTA